jgi:D-alanyl-D-alanine carboxypeptidase
MTRPASRTLSVLLVVAMAVGALLLAPAQAAGAVAGPSGHESTVAAPRRLHPGELRRLLDQLVAAGAPGAAALVRKDHAVTQAASGVADLRSGRRMRPGLNYRVGSVTKPFIATVVLQLVAEGRLSLSDTVERWLPGILPYGGRVTIRQLLNHTSGVPENSLEPLVILYTFPDGRSRSWTPRELVALIADQPPDFPPGTAWSYSNTGYVLAGMIVEAATGRKLGQELARRIFRPLRLRDTVFPVNRPDIPGPNPRGYSLPLVDEAGPLLDFTVYNPSLAWGAGNLISDLADLERFFRALLGGRLLPPRLLAQMTTPVDTGVPGYGYGLGLETLETPWGRLVGHGGAAPGFDNLVFNTKDGRRQLGVMINVFIAPTAVIEALTQVVGELSARLLEAAPARGASTGAYLPAAIPARTPTPTAQALDQVRAELAVRAQHLTGRHLR